MKKRTIEVGLEAIRGRFAGAALHRTRERTERGLGASKWRSRKRPLNRPAPDTGYLYHQEPSGTLLLLLLR
jgi:hypothetical protein